MLDVTAVGPFELFQFEVFSRAISENNDVFMITNEPNEYHNFQNNCIIHIRNQDIFGPNGNIKGTKTLIPGNPDVKIFKALQDPRLDSYECFIRIEFDVVCTINIREQLLQIVRYAEDNDFCSISFFPRDETTEDPWPWWQTFTNRHDPKRNIPAPLFGGMLQVCSFTRKYEQAYRDALADGWTAHYEVLMPTIAKWNDLRILNLGTTELIDYEVFGVHPPKNFEIKNNSLFHPVKDFNSFAFLPMQVIKQYLIYASSTPAELKTFNTNDRNNT